MAALLTIRVAALAGVGVTAYALYVERAMELAKKRGEQYEALCDIRGYSGFEASCTAVLGSSYARILSHWGLVPRGGHLDFSNAFLGLAFYVVALFHDKLAAVLLNPQLALMLASAGSLAFSGYLAYILNVVLKDFCIVCTSMYVCNIVIFVASVIQWRGSGGGLHAKTA